MSSSRPIVRVLFRVAGGRRLGFGHIARALSLARAMEAPAVLSVRGTRETRAIARRMGARTLSSSLIAALAQFRPELVVIDDPDAAASLRALALCRRLGARVASVHDLAIATIPSDVAIDGSIVRRGPLDAAASLTGPRYAILDPTIASLAAASARDGARALPREASPRVVVSLGGGPRRALGLRIAHAVKRAHPSADVIVAGGFAARARPAARLSSSSSSSPATVARLARTPVVRWLPSPDAFRPELARADVAVLAGGVTLYEAAALGVAAVALAVVPAQTPTVRGFAARRAVLNAGGVADGRSAAAATAIAAAVTRRVTRLLGDERLRRRIARRARGLVDGRGAWRVASALRELVTAS
jgi:spore coat polysaccharide biosynthesis predicted glycosyltransferase SpsG